MTADFATMAGLEGVPAALAGARDAVDSLLRDRGHRRTTATVTAAALLNGASASARLEGSRSTLSDLQEGSADKLAVASARLSAELLSLVPVVVRSPLQAVARMHALAAAGLVDDAELGRPLPRPGLAIALQDLARRLLAPTDAPAIAVAALAHAEVMRLAPFTVANGLVARGLERLLLVARGVDPASVTVPEAGHLALSAEYADALSAYSRADPAGQRRWLYHAVAAITRGVELSPLNQ
ncbi:MAG: oxidoreductase [Nocardioidaceae bacterium]